MDGCLPAPEVKRLKELDFTPGRYTVFKTVFPLFLLKPAAIMLNAVGYHEPGYIIIQIIKTDLIKYFPGNRNRRCFAFYKKNRLTLAVVNKYVRSLFHPVKIEFLFDGHK